VLDSLSLAVAALADPRPAVDSLVDVTRLGGDTDTNGAIAGGLLGARDGAGAWPSEWVRRLQFASEFKAAASVLAHSS
jgi:ADP-ribosylglycohydrolase